MSRSSPSPTRDSEREERTLRAIRQIPSARGQRRAHRAAYLLGMTDEVPSPSDTEVNQRRVIQACYDAMEHHEPAEGSSQAESWEINSIPSRRTFSVPFKVPLNTTKVNVQTTSVEVSFSSDAPPEDVFTRICAYMDVPRNYESLAWRLDSAPRTKMPNRLVTDDDLRTALKVAVDAIMNREEIEANNIGKNRKKKLPPPVIVEVINTSPATMAKNSRNKLSMQTGDLAPSMLPYTAELKIVKEALRCSLHPGDNTWCFIDKSRSDAPHIPLSLSDVQQWAHHLHIDKNADQTCVIPPNTLGFDNIRSRKPRGTSSVGSHVPTEPLTPVIHNHIHLVDPGHAITGANSLNIPAVAESSRMATHRQNAMYFESDNSDDDASNLCLDDILCAVHTKYPDYYYYQYEEKLRQCGILYLSTAGYFDTNFFISRVGMSEGAARHFQKWVEKERLKVYEKKQKKLGKKRARYVCDDDEKQNIDPRSAGDET